MRGNGLSAASYAAVADLDPRIADVLLELLRSAGVAAYAVPSVGHRGPYLDVHLPTRPTDRLYVDRDQTDRARLLLSDQLPQLRALLDASVLPAGEPPLSLSQSEHQAWQRIVADFDQPSTDPVPRWPVLEDVDDADAHDTPAATGPAPSHGEPPPLTERDIVSRPDPGSEEHFVPPPPPPLPRLDPVTRLAWIGFAGGPAVLVLSIMVGQMLPPLLLVLALVGFVAGFVVLVVRQRAGGPGEESDGGAVL